MVQILELLAYLTEISVNQTGARNVVLQEGCKTTLLNDVSMTILCYLWNHNVNFTPIFRQRQRIRNELYRIVLDQKMLF